MAKDNFANGLEICVYQVNITINVVPETQYTDFGESKYLNELNLHKGTTIC